MNSKISDPSQVEVDEFSALEAELAAIGATEPEVKEKRGFAGSAFQDPDPDDEDVIFEPVKLTRYDKALIRLREREAKRDAILSKGELSVEDQRRLLVTNETIASAQRELEKASERAKDDNARRQESIDEWRKTDEGKLIRNAKRRKVRDQPNNDLSHLKDDPEKLAQYNRDKRSDANWLKRKRDKGIPEHVIRAAYALRLEERQKERGLGELPGYGLF
ncbi:hypothetical protein [Celeribacter sp.]|uniref:hypothetical protein n=1 Tax=Celeribacter sp. TaxID=1890673 RepID=UPI003A8F49D5